jgi:hypothetical protein
VGPPRVRNKRQLPACVCSSPLLQLGSSASARHFAGCRPRRPSGRRPRRWRRPGAALLVLRADRLNKPSGEDLVKHPLKARLTEEEKQAAAEVAKRSKELTAKLKLKHAQVLKARERQNLLETEIKRYDKVHAQAEKQRAKIAELLKEIEELEQQIVALQARVALVERPSDPHEDGGR